jgi:hypothetical protein
MRYIFTNVIAKGAVDFKSPFTAAHQPDIRECFMVYVDEDKPAQAFEESFTAEPTSQNLHKYAEAIASGWIVVGHSVSYHHGHLRAELIKRGSDPCDGRIKTICTMLGLAGRVPKFNGRNGWPSFAEVCHHYGITRAGTESAEDNARCLMQAFNSAEHAGIKFEPKIWKE